MGIGCGAVKFRVTFTFLETPPPLIVMMPRCSPTLNPVVLMDTFISARGISLPSLLNEPWAGLKVIQLESVVASQFKVP